MWAQLVCGDIDEQAALAVLAGWVRRPGCGRMVRAVMDAIVAGDRRLEAAAWRVFETSQPGVVSEVPVHGWRFHPETGAPLDRYSLSAVGLVAA